MASMTDQANTVAFNQDAPQAERTEALAELQQAHRPGVSDMIPADEMRPVIDHILGEYQANNMMKSGAVVPFPSHVAKAGQRGMQSVRLDDWALSVQGDYWERPSALGFDSMRAMVEQTPILNAVVMTRIRQVQRFCRVAESNDSQPGFEIRHVDRQHQIQGEEAESIKLLNRFMSNCGWEFNPRKRKALRRDSFSGFMSKVVRDTLTMDSAAIETEWKRNKALGIDGFYAVDGATIRLCTEDGYRGDDEIFALQVVQGRISTPYTFENLIYEPRNPRSDVTASGYGLSEVELLVRVVTGFLNAMTYNIKGFDNNAIPKGMLHLSGNYTSQDVDAFKRYWNGMVKGVNNQWSLPVMVSKDQDSKASFEKFGVEYNEMYFSKWMTFLTSLICAIFGMSPAEINFDSFTAGSSSALSGSDTAEKLAASKDSGLRPLLSYFENLFTDFIMADFSDKYVFRWTGLDPEDAEKRHELRKLVLTVNEVRAEEGYEAMEGDLGEAPLNPSLIGPWMQMTQQAAQADEQPDFGHPVGKPGDDDQDKGGKDGDDVKEGGDQEDGKPNGPGQEKPEKNDLDDGQRPTNDEGLDFGKSFASPIYVIGE
jgi:hypothetical protein